MSVTVNPFRKGSKRYDLADRLLKGGSKDKIVKDLKLKDKSPIYQLNSAWKKIRAKAKAEERARRAVQYTVPPFFSYGST